MQITVLGSVSEANPHDLCDATVIVIDILRATSNIVTAFMHGCREIVPLASIEAAKSLQDPGDLLAGERNCLRIAGFDLGNSPYEYMSPLVEDKRILMTTTNGTRVMRHAEKARHILAGAFLNARAAAAAAVELKHNICILCAGTNDAFSWEDGLCAGLLVQELQQLTGQTETVDDLGLCMQSSYLSVKPWLQQALLRSANGRKLSRLGFAADIGYCAQVDITGKVPALENGRAILYRSKSVCPS